MRIRLQATLVSALSALVFALGGQAFADYAKVAVTPPGVPSCLGSYYAVFTTIQAAITSTPSGGTIFVCPGIYAEQFTLNKKVLLEGYDTATQGAAVVVPPVAGLVQNAADSATGGPIAAQILVTANSVQIQNLTVDGAGNGLSGCALDLQGVRYQNASSGTINHVVVRNQIPGGSLANCSSGGEGIVVQSSGVPAAVLVENNSIHGYNTNGLTGIGAGVNLTASGNYIQGSGLVAGGPVQNGIELGYGAQGKITINTVLDNASSSGSPLATGILLYDAAENAGVSVATNVLGNDWLPIAIETGGDDGGNLGDGVSVTNNKIAGAVGDAIDVCTNGNTLTSNTIVDSGQSAVHFDASCGALFSGTTGTHNAATKNTFTDGNCAGILDDFAGAGGNSQSANIFYQLPFLVAYSTVSCPYVAADVSHRVGHNTAKVRPIR